MIKTEIIKIGSQLNNQIKDYVRNAIINAFEQIGKLFGERDQNAIETQPWQLIGFDTPSKPAANFDNLTWSDIASSSQQKGEEFMQQLQKIKNARLRKDGRFEWRKMINGHCYQIIDSDFASFRSRVNQAKKTLKRKSNAKLIIPGQTSAPQISLFDLAKKYYERHIASKVTKGLMKPRSAQRYVESFKMIEQLKKPIADYTKDEMIDYFNTLDAHRSGSYVYFLLKNVFADEFEKGNINRNPIASFKNPFSHSRYTKKGSWLNLDQQRKLKAALDDSIIAKEIAFYLGTGCRLIEAYDAEIDFAKHIVHVHRHKTETYAVTDTYIPISDKLCRYIQNDWPKMFKTPAKYMSKNIGRFFNRLGITNKATHALRHTFSSNLYYLGVDAKRQQYLMGHASIKQTFDTYTTLDLSVTKDDILSIWDDFYPNF